jgi:hypothetical protein
MNFQGLRIFFGQVMSLLLVAGLGSPLISDQDTPVVVVRYEQLLDRVFPIEVDDATEYTVVLRFLPGLGKESQITIARRPEDGFTVVYHVLPDNSVSIWSRLAEESLQEKSFNLEEIAAMIRINRKEVRVEPDSLATLMQRLKEIKLAPCLRQPEQLQFDSDQYVFMFSNRNPKTEIRITLVDRQGLAECERHPLIEWMNQVRRLIEAEIRQGPLERNESHSERLSGLPLNAGAGDSGGLRNVLEFENLLMRLRSGFPGWFRRFPVSCRLALPADQ